MNKRSDVYRKPTRSANPALLVAWPTVVHDERLLWPDTLSVAADGYLYVTAISFIAIRYSAGRTSHASPYVLFRTPIGAARWNYADNSARNRRQHALSRRHPRPRRQQHLAQEC